MQMFKINSFICMAVRHIDISIYPAFQNHNFSLGSFSSVLLLKDMRKCVKSEFISISLCFSSKLFKVWYSVFGVCYSTCSIPQGVITVFITAYSALQTAHPLGYNRFQ